MQSLQVGVVASDQALARINDTSSSDDNNDDDDNVDGNSTTPHRLPPIPAGIARNYLHLFAAVSTQLVSDDWDIVSIGNRATGRRQRQVDDSDIAQEMEAKNSLLGRPTQQRAAAKRAGLFIKADALSSL